MLFEKPVLSTQELIRKAIGRICEAIAEYQPVAIFGMFSGGHDSLTATYIASHVKGFTAACHINTGIGITKTRQFVYDTCREQGWPLKEYKAMENLNRHGEPDPQDYAEFVRKLGFPGPHGHNMMYARLKERQIRRLTREYKTDASSKIMLISGCRSQESQRRMRNTEPVQEDGSRIWVNPIHDFSKLDCGNVIKWFGLKRNEVVDLIHKSGECLCGAFAKPGELAELEMWFPEDEGVKLIKQLEAEVKPKFGWGWEGKPKRCPKLDPRQIEMPLCHNCLIGNPNDAL